MSRGQHRTEAEDTAIEHATLESLAHGILAFRPHSRTRVRSDPAGRVRTLACELGRPCAAVRKRAERIGARSDPAREGETSR